MALFWLVAAALLMLTPAPSTVSPGGETDLFCFICGFRTVSDALLNVAFFVPLGWSLRRSWGWQRALIGVVAISLSVEIIQLAIPGRVTSFTDVISNSLGGLLGAWLVYRERHVVPALAFGAVLAVVGPLALLAPSAPGGVYYGQWTARFEDMTPYEGRVLEASVGTIEVPSRRSEHSAALRRAIGEGEPIRIVFEAGLPPEGLAPVFSIFDGRRRRILLVGAEGEDVVLERWTRATTLYLDSPALRWPGVLAGITEGDTVSMALGRSDSGLCLTIDERMQCETTQDAGAGWTLLVSPDGLSPTVSSVMGSVWMLLMGVLLGLPRGTVRLRLTLVGALTVVIQALSANLPYMRGSMPQAVALITGTVLGLLIRRRIGVR